MSTKLLLTIGTLLFQFGLAEFSFAGHEINLTKNAAPGGLVQINNVRGEITVIGWNRDQISIVGELDDLADELIFKVNKKTALIEVRIPRRNAHWGDGSDLRINVPEHSRVDIDGVSTEITVQNILGGLRVKSVSGDVSAEKIHDRILITSVSGEVVVEDSQGLLRASTVSGGLSIRSHIGGAELESVSGEIGVRSEKNSHLRIRNVSGDVEIRTRLEPEALVEIETVSGDIELELRGQANAYFDLDAGMGGEIDNDLSDDQVTRSFMGQEKLKMTLGDGSARIRIRTMSANIRIE